MEPPWRYQDDVHFAPLLSVKDDVRGPSWLDLLECHVHRAQILPAEFHVAETSPRRAPTRVGPV